MANAVALALPVPTLRVIGLESDATANIIGTVALTLPVPKISTSGYGSDARTVALTLPVPTLSVRGSTQVAATVRLVLPAPTLQVQGNTALVGSVTLVMPMPRLSVVSNDKVSLTLPTPQIAISGIVGTVGNVRLTVPTPTLSVVGRVPFTANVGLTLPTPQLAITGTVGNVGSVNNTLRGLALAITGATGIIGSAHMTLPVPILDIQGYQQGIGSVTLALPMLLLQVTGQVGSATEAEPDGDVLPAIVMQIETGALTEYTNFPFNSLAAFNGAYLGASAEGLFVLGGDTDNAALINAVARVGITDFGTSFLKRIDRCYVGYRTNGNLIVRVFTDEINVRDYLITAYGKGGLHGNHTRIGKGLAARYWQFEIRNQNGTQFQLNAIELKPTHLRRRIGGGDA